MDPTPAPAHHPAADFNRALRSTSETEAFGLLLRAAERGCLRAQFLVGLAYHTGRGVAVDYQRAGEWYRKAAGSGDSHAIANLGVMSLLGQGAPADDVEAYVWVQSAVGLGHQWLRSVLELLEDRVAGRFHLSHEAILNSVSPEYPALDACTQPVCDHARCNVA